MKKLQIFALAALVAVGLSSCLKDQVVEIDPAKGTHKLTIKMAGMQETRAIGAQADATADIIINSGRIFVFDATGTFVTSQALASGFVSGNGQQVDELVPTGAQVYVVANVAGLATSYATLNDLKIAAFDVDQTVAYTQVPLVNVGATAVTIATTDAPGAVPGYPTAQGTATASVSIAPASARLELVAVNARNIKLNDANGDNTTGDVATSAQIRSTAMYTQADIQNAKITGVYLTSYYPQYTLGASFAGTIINQNEESGYNGVGDELEVVFAGTGIAKNTGVNQVWNYSVAAGAAATASPRLIVTLNKSDESAAEQNKTLTISGYGAGFQGFKPGNIYRIQAIDFAAGEWEDLPEEPQFQDFLLEVTIEVVKWNLVDNLTPDLQ